MRHRFSCLTIDPCLHATLYQDRMNIPRRRCKDLFRFAQLNEYRPKESNEQWRINDRSASDNGQGSTRSPVVGP
jgi:hypothetical protein